MFCFWTWKSALEMIGNKMLFLFPLIAGTFAYESGDRIACDGVIFHDVYMAKELLFSDRGRPYNLVYHKFSSVLFFSHTIQNGTFVDFGITACHTGKKSCRDIAGVPGGYALAYDEGHDDIYIGGHNGIYKYNYITRSADFFAEKGKSIWGIFVKNHFYYIEYPTQKLYVYDETKFVKVLEAEHIEVDIFFISKHNDIYFSNKTALYKIEKADKQKTVLVLNDEVAVRQIVEDTYGDVYFVVNDGIYLEEKPYQRIMKVAHIDQAFGLAFSDKEHIIYSDESSIYRLSNSDYANQCYNALQDAKQIELYDALDW